MYYFYSYIKLILNIKNNRHLVAILQFYKINFGYTQVLFMGSVPRINCLLAIVPLKHLYYISNVRYILKIYSIF